MLKTDMEKFYESVHFLQNHRIFGDRFWEGLDVMVVKVDPKTKRYEDDPAQNTMVQIWLEAGPLLKKKPIDDPRVSDWCHDINLDCGGDTFEEAIIHLATKVRRKYGV